MASVLYTETKSLKLLFSLINQAVVVTSKMYFIKYFLHLSFVLVCPTIAYHVSLGLTIQYACVGKMEVVVSDPIQLAHLSFSKLLLLCAWNVPQLQR